MSQVVDQRLFELVQVVSVSNSTGGESRRRFSIRSSTRQSPAAAARAQSRQIVSFASTPCGRLVVFAAAGQAETGEASCPESRPFIASVLFSKTEDSAAQLISAAASAGQTSEHLNSEVHWLPWFQDTKLKPTCLTISPESDFILIGCVNGSLYILSVKSLCSGFDSRLEKEQCHKDWPTRRTLKVFPVDNSSDSKGVYSSNFRHSISILINTSVKYQDL
jgi:hypothetical protein